jgi:hypothetical protein
MEKIGRYQLAITSIVSIEQWGGLLFYIWPRYKVLLTNGRTLYFNEAEKRRYDEALGLHQSVVYCYGVARAHGLRG